ncbi:hypothetical protein MHYP_G00024420 [Metynnis hypsauchen]
MAGNEFFMDTDASNESMCRPLTDVLNPSNCKLEGGRRPGVFSLQCSGSQLTREETKDFIWGEKRKKKNWINSGLTLYRNSVSQCWFSGNILV